MNFWCVFQLTVELFILIPTKKPTHIFRRLLVKLVKYTQQYERVKKKRRKKPATMTKQIKQVLESLGNHTLKLIGASVSNGDFSFITGTKKKTPPNNKKKTTHPYHCSTCYMLPLSTKQVNAWRIKHSSIHGWALPINLMY